MHPIPVDLAPDTPDKRTALITQEHPEGLKTRPWGVGERVGGQPLRQDAYILAARGLLDCQRIRRHTCPSASLVRRAHTASLTAYLFCLCCRSRTTKLTYPVRSGGCEVPETTSGSGQVQRLVRRRATAVGG